MLRLRWLLASFATELGKQLPTFGNGKNPSTTWTLASLRASKAFIDVILAVLRFTPSRKDSILALKS